MVKDIVMVVLLLLGGIAYYVYNRSSKGKQGGGSPDGMMAWLTGLSDRTGKARPSSSESGSSSAKSRGRSAVEMETQIASLLDDVYEEFISETQNARDEFRKEIDALRSGFDSRLTAIEVRLEQLSRGQSVSERLSHPRAQTEPASLQANQLESVPSEDIGEENQYAADSSMADGQIPAGETEAAHEDTSFKILEALYSGQTVAEVAAALEVGVQEVEMVRQLLHLPPSK